MAPAISTPVAPPPTTTKFKQAAALGRIRLGLRFFERQQDAPAQVGRVVDRLEPRRVGGPIVMAEIGVLRAGRDDQIIERDASAFGDHLVARKVDARDLGEHDADVPLAS